MSQRHLYLFVVLLTLPLLSCVEERGGTQTSKTKPIFASPVELVVGVQDGTPVEITNSVGMKLKPIPAGEFMMGSPDLDDDVWDHDEHPQHEVRITQPFYLGVTQVTQAQWYSVMRTKPWTGTWMYKDDVQVGPDYPVCGVTWDDAVAFCRTLSDKEGVSYRLPSEAEWEYACRAGTTTVYSFGDDESQHGDYAWTISDTGGKTPTVGQKRPNAWGLFMHERMFEWCHDWYGPYGNQQVVSDPKGPSEGDDRVVRGGSFVCYGHSLRSAYRSYRNPVIRSSTVSLRVVRTCP